MNDQVYIITATIGHAGLEECLRSVEQQTYKNIVHIVVIDGEEARDRSMSVLGRFSSNKNLKIIQLPWNTGGTGYTGYLIYSAITQLLENGYVAFLDDDNYFDRDHIQICMGLTKKYNLDWCYSLRKLIRESGEFLFNDDCQSLGIWPCYEGIYHLVDTSCYFIRTDVAVRFIDVVMKKMNTDGLKGDVALLKALMSTDLLFACTGAYSLNYRLKSAKYSEEGMIKWFEKGNRIYKSIYNIFPWADIGYRRRFPDHPALMFDNNRLTLEK